MTLLNQADWYDDPNDPAAQRYWDGSSWTPHRRRKPIQQATPRQSPPPPPLPPPPRAASTPPPVHSPPHPGDVTAAMPAQPTSQPISRSRSRPRKLALAIASTAVLIAVAIGGFLGYRYYFVHQSTSAEQSSPASGAQFAHDLAAAGIVSADPDENAGMNLPAGPESTAHIVAVATAVCADLNNGAGKDAEATQIYQGALAGTPSGRAPLALDKAAKVVDLAVQDVCPGA